MGVWREVARRFAFVEYDGPPLEPLELYTKKSGDEIVGQLYNFTDKGGREVALRPEMTPTLARMAAAQGERAAQTGALVLDAAALSLRAAAARAPARALSAQRRHHRRSRTSPPTPSCSRSRSRSCAAAGSRRATCARACPTAGCSARCSPALGVGEAQLPAVFGVVDKVERQPRDVSRREARRRRASPAESIESLLAARWTTSTLDDDRARRSPTRPSVADARRRDRGATSAALDGARRARVGDARPHDRARARVLHRHRVRAVRREGRAARHLRRRPLRQSAPDRSAASTCRRSGSAWATSCSRELLRERGLHAVVGARRPMSGSPRYRRGASSATRVRGRDAAAPRRRERRVRAASRSRSTRNAAPPSRRARRSSSRSRRLPRRTQWCEAEVPIHSCEDKEPRRCTVPQLDQCSAPKSRSSVRSNLTE